MLFIEFSHEKKKEKAVKFWKNKVSELIENAAQNEPEQEKNTLVKKK